MGDILFFVNLLKKEKKILFLVLILCLSFGIGYLLLVPNRYIAKTTFITQSSKSTGASGLGNLAAIAGVQLGTSGDAELISPNLYKEIIHSNKFLHKLINTKFIDPIDGKKKKLKKIYIINIKDTVSSATVDEDIKIFKISNTDYSLFKILRRQININYIEEENKFLFSVENENPILAANLLAVSKSILQETIIQYKLDKAKQNLVYIKKNFEEKKKEFLSIQRNLAYFQDNNRSLITKSSQAKLTKLKSEYDLAFTLYSELAKKVQLQELKIKEDMPVFITIKEVSIPNEKSSPIYRNVLAISLLLGLLLGIIVVMFNNLKIIMNESPRLNK